MLFHYFLLWTLLGNRVAAEDIKEGEGYSFHYQVDSNKDNVHFRHNEDRRGYRTIGSYKTLLPDGRTQVVEYKVHDKDSGYMVSYQGVSAVGEYPYLQPRFKGIKREITAGSHAHTVKIKPYGRDIEHQTQQVSDIYTTITPSAIESVTVIPSPEIVTIEQKYDFDVETSYKENHQEGDSTQEVIKHKGNVLHSNITDTYSVKDVTEASKSTTVYSKTTEPVKIIPSTETVTRTIEPKVNKEKFDKYYFSLALGSENSTFNQENVKSIQKETNIIPQKIYELTATENILREKAKNKGSVTEGTDHFELVVGSANANVAARNPNIYKIKHNSNPEQPTYEYNFKPIKNKTTLTKAKDKFDTKNKALYQTNFTPCHHPYLLQKYYRTPRYTLPYKKHNNQYLALHLPFVSHTRRRDGLSPPKNKNVIEIKTSRQIPTSSVKNWFSFFKF